MNLNFLQEKKEADFRYGLVRVRENAESIAFYSGEESEMQLLLQRFKSAFENLTVRYLFFIFTIFTFKTIFVHYAINVYVRANEFLSYVAYISHSYIP